MSKSAAPIMNLWAWFRKTYLKLLFFAMVFGLIKLSGFAAAIFMLHQAGVAAYGVFEYALAAGLIMAIPLNIGLQGAYPYFNLRLKESGFRSLFYFHSLLVGGSILLLLSLDSWWWHLLSSKLVVAALMGAIFSMQMMLSSILKSHEKIIKAVLMDGFMYLIINAFLCFVLVSEFSFSLEALESLLFWYLSALVIVFAYWWYRTRSEFFLANYYKALEYGRHLVLSSFLIILFTGSARLFIEFFMDMETVGYYSFYLRFATIAIMIQQVFLIAFFKKVYQTAPAILDKYFSVFLVFITIVSMLLWWLVPLLLSNQFALMQESIGTYGRLYLILCFHTVFWTCLAFNENIIHRERLSSKMNRWLLLFLGLMLGGLFLLNHLGVLSVFSLAMINLVSLFAAVESQFYILRRFKNFKLTASNMVLRGILLLFVLIYLMEIF